MLQCTAVRRAGVSHIRSATACSQHALGRHRRCARLWSRCLQRLGVLAFSAASRVQKHFVGPTHWPQMVGRRSFDRAEGPGCVRQPMRTAMLCACMVRSRCRHLGYDIGCASWCLAHIQSVGQHRCVGSSRVRSLFGPSDRYGNAVRPIGHLSLGGCVLPLLFASAVMCSRHPLS